MSTPLASGFVQTVNPTAAAELDPALAALRNGQVAIAYETGGGIAAVVRGIDGGLVLPPIPVAASGSNPAVAGLADGRFLVVWQRFAGSTEVVAQAYNADGSASGPEVIVADTAVSSLARPDVAADGDGGFTVSWTSNLNAGDVLTLRFDGAGQPVAGSDGITPAAGAQGTSAVAVDADGDFPDRMTIYSDGTDVRADIVRQFGSNLSLPVATGVGSQGEADAAALAAGGWVAVWTDDATGDVQGRLVSVGGTLGLPFTVNTALGGVQSRPKVAGLPDGRFVVVWVDETDQRLEGQLFDADGQKNGAEFQIAGFVDSAIVDGIALTATRDGRIVASWSSDLNGLSQVYFTSIDPRQAGVTLNGSAIGEEMAGTIYSDLLRGQLGDDILRGQGGDDEIYGQAGDDILYGRAGNDILDGGDGSDVVDGGAGDDQIAAGAGDDRVFGGSGADFIDGAGGNDLLFGDTGLDTLSGGAGNDTYYFIVPDNDVIVDGSGLDTISAGASMSLAPYDDIENLDFLFATAAVTGSGNALDNDITGTPFNDTLAGGAGADTLRGSAGTDSMTGGNGSDTYYVDTPSDQVIETAADPAIGGNDTVYAQDNYKLGANIEILRLQGAAGLEGTGNTLDNKLYGNTGANDLSGLDGNDTLAGGEGGDTLRGGAGDDSMNGGAGDDVFYVDSAGDIAVDSVNAGIDTVYAVAAHTLSANIENLRMQGAAGINANGNALDNHIFGNSGANRLQGLDGDDTLDGKDGADTLAGGDGNDTLTGGGQADVFRFAAANAGIDRILDFNSNADRFDLSGGAFTAVSIAPNGDAVLTHPGGTVRVASPPNLTLAQWNALVLPSGARTAHDTVTAADDASQAPVLHAADAHAGTLLRHDIVPLPHGAHGDWVFA